MSTAVNYHRVLKRLQNTWVLCYGLLTALNLLGLWVPRLWLPLCAAALVAPIAAFGNRNLASKTQHCSLMSHYTVYTLLLSALDIIIVNLIHTRWFISAFPNLAVADEPFIAALVIYPTATLFFGLAMLRRGHTEYCQKCRQRAGYSVRETLEGNVFHSEAKVLVRFSFIVSLILCATVWTYYFMFYIKVNINDADKFFYFILPTAVYALGAFYIHNRYASMQFEINMAPGRGTDGLSSMVRFMVMRDGNVLLKQMVADKHGHGLWDTPAFANMPFTETFDEAEAHRLFIRLSGTEDFSLRPLFVTNTATHNAFHFAVVLDHADTPVPGLEGVWYSLYEIHNLLKHGLASRPFAYEMHRIFTATMAWKTYDRNGKRLYPIKNYKPTFRLVDFKEWTLDYSDPHWLSVARNNEDKPLWKLRRFWRRHISSVDKQ